MKLGIKGKVRLIAVFSFIFLTIMTLVNNYELNKLITNSQKLENIISEQKNVDQSLKNQIENDNDKFKTTAMVVNISMLAIFGIANYLVAMILRKAIMKPFYDVLEQSKRIADGDLSTHVENEEVGEMHELLTQMNVTADNLDTMLKEIKASAEAVAKSSTEISAGNQDLAQRTQEQASSLEETSSAIEELSATVKQNADNANKANSLAKKTRDVVFEGNQVVSDTIQAMSAVNDSSRKIAEIINVVNDIAFQTNLLALNAAVEAARAGEQGRGFAVVAVEVRNLAGRSAEAAKEIQSLINDSVDKVKNGNELVLQTGNQLDKITESIQTVSELVAEISAASHEQSMGIEEVSKAIVQMDQATQQNASLVEQSAAASDTIKEEANQLYEYSRKFKLKNELESNYVSDNKKSNRGNKAVYSANNHTKFDFEDFDKF